MPGQILVECELPLRWSRLSVAHSAQYNQLAFAMLDALEDTHHARPDADSQSELARIESKLNLILQLLNQLLHKDDDMPALQTVRFASDSVAWPAAELTSGTSVLLQLYLDSAVPVPVVLQGTVVALEHGWVRLGLNSLNEEQQASWTRWVFRQHRREVARQRQQAGA